MVDVANPTIEKVRALVSSYGGQVFSGQADRSRYEAAGQTFKQIVDLLLELDSAPIPLPALFAPASRLICPCGSSITPANCQRDGQFGGDIFDNGEHGTAHAEYRCERCGITTTITAYA